MVQMSLRVLMDDIQLMVLQVRLLIPLIDDQFLMHLEQRGVDPFIKRLNFTPRCVLIARGPQHLPILPLHTIIGGIRPLILGCAPLNLLALLTSRPLQLLLLFPHNLLLLDMIIHVNALPPEVIRVNLVSFRCILQIAKFSLEGALSGLIMLRNFILIFGLLRMTDRAPL